MTLLTYNQAQNHLDGVAALATAENRYLTCVQDYLESVELDVLPMVRADTIKGYEDLRLLILKQQNTKALVVAWRRGGIT